MTTAFIHTRVPVAPGLSFVLDGNSKITASNGTYAAPTPNALSLPAASVDVGGGSNCPGSTPTCRASCYVRGLAKAAPDVYAAYQENRATLACLLGPDENDGPLSYTAGQAARRLGEWIAKNASGGFRWHVSGDVVSEQHARWITLVCFASPDVRHWIYTRTLEAVFALTLAPNLTVNVSADQDNYDAARAVVMKNRARLCYLASADGAVPPDLPKGSVIFPDYALRGRDLADPTSAPWWGTLSPLRRTRVCPADFFGQSESHRCGPCDHCIRPVEKRA